ncbi:homeobox-leucine zipper protein athb-7 [Phtheirospermum japonicum]|uniref:Homeobox-leucine zipper protein n=1 Tax=Phtheirospermum japonicum TaxID=374723 RepID=A0A830BUY4_9LAMI|nr:homeobox-leucine zipper protein athb-7 [Phtheirospermum japonicum]
MESPNNSSSPEKTNDEIRKYPKSTKRKNSKNIVAKRFSVEQIKSLESIFKLDTKLEPKRKLQIASDLGLQPRQVAIWFQNKRARWRSKQIEQEYKELRANYDSLYMQFDDLKREKQILQTQACASFFYIVSHE